MTGFRQLLKVAERLTFEPHDIRDQLDATGYYALALAREFPLSIRLFHYSSRDFTRGVTWHTQLELFVPLDGRTDIRMGNREVQLEAGDVLVVDNLKLHHVVDHPGFDTRAVVISFLPEFVYSLGSPSHDFAFLLPFHAQFEDRAHVLRRADSASPEVHAALAQLLECYFLEGGAPYREAGCKARLLGVLFPLARCFQDAAVDQWEFERQRQRAGRFSKLLDQVQRHPAEKLPLADAARLCGMSPAQFTRTFKQVAGMTYVAYVTHVRLAEAARLLKGTDLTIAEIASKTGFTDQSYFDRRFKQAFGVTPRTFQQQARGNSG